MIRAPPLRFAWKRWLETWQTYSPNGGGKWWFALEESVKYHFEQINIINPWNWQRHEYWSYGSLGFWSHNLSDTGCFTLSRTVPTTFCPWARERFHHINHHVWCSHNTCDWWLTKWDRKTPEATRKQKSSAWQLRSSVVIGVKENSPKFKAYPGFRRADNLCHHNNHLHSSLFIIITTKLQKLLKYICIQLGSSQRSPTFIFRKIWPSPTFTSLPQASTVLLTFRMVTKVLKEICVYLVGGFNPLEWSCNMGAKFTLNLRGSIVYKYKCIKVYTYY